MKTLRLIETRLSQILEFIITLFFGIILATTILLVILRYVFNSGIYGGNELMSYLFVYTTALGAAISIGSDDHIKINVIASILTQGWKKVVEIICLILVGGLNLILIFMSVPWIQKVGSFESPTLRIPNAWVQFGVPLGCSFAVLFCIFRIIRVAKGEDNATSAD